METRGLIQDGNGDRSGDGNESSSGDGNGDGSGDENESSSGDGNGDGNEGGIGEDGGKQKKRKKPHNSCRHDPAVSFRMRRHLCRQEVAAPYSSIRKARCSYTRISPRV